MTLTHTKDNHTIKSHSILSCFAGFYNPSSKYTGSLTNVNLNPGNDKTVTVTALWELTFAQYLLKIASDNGGNSSSTSMIGATGLHYEQGTYSHYLVFAGKEVNNYVNFNNETWRILGVHRDICTDATCSIKQDRVKIVRDKSIGNMQWSNSTVTIAIQ